MLDHDQTTHHHDEDHVFFFGTHRLIAPRSHMKVGELKELIERHVPGFVTAHVLVEEECGDRPDRPLNDDDELHIHNCPHFYDQPPATFGLTSPLVELQFERLKERYPNATLTPLSNEVALVTVPKCLLGARWSAQEATIYFLAPNGYPVAAPDCFWVEPKLSLDDQVIPKNSKCNQQIPETGIVAHWFSWHVTNGHWLPNQHDLLTWLGMCLARLQVFE